MGRGQRPLGITTVYIYETIYTDRTREAEGGNQLQVFMRGQQQRGVLCTRKIANSNTLNRDLNSSSGSHGLRHRPSDSLSTIYNRSCKKKLYRVQPSREGTGPQLPIHGSAVASSPLSLPPSPCLCRILASAHMYV
jgi:hypothetical protein